MAVSAYYASRIGFFPLPGLARQSRPRVFVAPSMSCWDQNPDQTSMEDVKLPFRRVIRYITLPVKNHSLFLSQLGANPFLPSAATILRMMMRLPDESEWTIRHIALPYLLPLDVLRADFRFDGTFKSAITLLESSRCSLVLIAKVLLRPNDSNICPMIRCARGHATLIGLFCTVPTLSLTRRKKILLLRCEKRTVGIGLNFYALFL
jgi:hypothetical protein